MINKVVKLITGKDIILYHKHYRTEPLANNSCNKQRLWFINIAPLWKYIPFKSSDKRKFKVMYFILDIIHPKYILNINWITRRDRLCKVWTKNNPESKFIVLQHGSYYGGIVGDTAHKYAKCDIFLTWGPYFVDRFTETNSGKNVEIINFGNSIYNKFDRSDFAYKERRSNKILILPTALDRENILYLYDLTNRLIELGFQVDIKEHFKQGKDRDSDGNIRFPSLKGEGLNIINGPRGSVFGILKENDYDFIIADHSSSLLDSIFFKNKVIYFDPNNSKKGYTTNYSKFITNLNSEEFQKMDKNSFYEVINLENQEALFFDMVFLGNNRIDSFARPDV